MFYFLRRFSPYRVKRAIRYFFQRIFRGWDDRETWSLDWTIAKFVLPRLKRFKEVNNGYPPDLTPEKWDEILDKMIFAFDYHSKDSFLDIEVEEAKINEGFALFVQYYHHLWW